jgi:hypothetical protein
VRGFNGLAAHGDGPRELARPVRLPVDQVGASPRVEQAGDGWMAAAARRWIGWRLGLGLRPDAAMVSSHLDGS